MVVMPDHFHCIIENTGETVGANLRVRPYCDPDAGGEHEGSPLGRVVQWFKTMTTNDYIRGVQNHGWQRFEKKLWQRNYWERFFNDDQSYQKIADYILRNPENWQNKNSL